MEAIAPEIDLQLRPAKDSDFDLLLDLHRAAMKPSIAESHGWNESAERAFIRGALAGEGYWILESEGVAIGGWACERRVDSVYLAYIGIAPSHQGRGIGTRMLRELLAIAREQGVPLRLHVLRTSRARRLYERLGFEYVARTPTGFQMQHDGSETDMDG